MPDRETPRILKAIAALGYRLTAADVAGHTGLGVDAVSDRLNHLAWRSGGHLEVGEAGAIVYCFPPSVERDYRTRNLLERLGGRFDKVFQAGRQAVRASFGVLLIGSLLFTPIFVAVQLVGRLPLFCLYLAVYGSLPFLFGNDEEASLSACEWERLGRSIKRHKGVLSARQIAAYTHFHIFFHSRGKLYRLLTHFGGYLDKGTEGEDIYVFPHWKSIATSSREIASKALCAGGILSNCFSFLFGTADPNCDLGERRWQLIAEKIKDGGGVITCDELAPFSISHPGSHLEDLALPPLLRFNGKALATEQGNIVYSFPSLQVTAKEHEDRLQTPSYLEERTWELCDIPKASQRLILVIALLNLLSSSTLWYFWRHPDGSGGLFDLLADGLLLYSALFLAVPAARWIFIQYANAVIDERNKLRTKYARRLEKPAPKLAVKLAESRSYALPEEHVLSAEIVYSTDRELVEQDIDHL